MKLVLLPSYPIVVKVLMFEERWKTDITRREGYIESKRQIKLQIKIQKEAVRALKCVLSADSMEERQDCM